MGGFVTPKNLKKCMKLNWNFQMGGGGGGVLEKIPFVGKVWIFSGITHFFLHIIKISFPYLLCHGGGGAPDDGGGGGGGPCPPGP